ncbi:hypothetical protein HYU95_03620 [Candidatus Daviesbacteria bacterium]|nr:hypothetical protein [Candidatus Daviesbacteria bacterium]
MKIQNSKFKIQNYDDKIEYPRQSRDNSKIKSPPWRTTILLTFNFLLLTFPSPAYAACVDPAGVKIGECFGFGDFTSFGGVVSKLVPAAFSIAAAAVVLYFLWGAFNYLKSGGNKEEVAGARQIITHSIIGFIILIFAFLILQFLLSSLFGITGFQLFQS